MTLITTGKGNHMKFAVIALMIISMSGCGDNLGLGPFTEEGKMQAAVIASLNDPDSAKFGKMTQVDESNACLTVNAKNAMGGYTGDQQAYLTKSKSKWTVLQINGDLDHEGCITVMTKDK